MDLLNKASLKLKVESPGGSSFGGLVDLITQSEDGESSAISAEERVALTPAHVPTAGESFSAPKSTIITPHPASSGKEGAWREWSPNWRRIEMKL